MKGKNLIWGLFFILAGAAVILSKLGLLGGVSALSVVISLLLIPIIVNSIRRLNFWGIFCPLAVMAILFAEPLGIEKLTPFPVLITAVCLSIGLSLIFPYRYRMTQKKWSGRVYGKPEGTKNSYDGENVQINASFAGATNYITSQQFKKADIFCHYSGSEVYFDGADMAENRAEINLDVLCSGLELYIPREWMVRIEADCRTGGITEEGATNSAKLDKTLVIRGRIKASGVTITYV